MFKRFTFVGLVAVVIVAMLSVSFWSTPVAAQDDPFPVAVEFEGVVKTVTSTEITFEDGTVVNVNVEVSGDIQPGTVVTVVASIAADDNLILITVTVSVAQATVEPTVEPTLEPTAAPTLEPTAAPTSAPECGSGNTHPVGARLAEGFGVSYEEIMAWKCKGYGFGEIARAYGLAKETGKSVEDIFAMRAGGQGWGNIVKELGVKPNKLAPGLVIKSKGKNAPDAESTDANGKGKQEKDKDNKGNNGKTNEKGKGKK